MISVIVPMYNAEKFIKQCVDSILLQNTDIEVLLIDDGSTDNTGAICRVIANTDKRVSYFYKNNSGVSDTRNYGIERARGEYLAFVDSDDMLPMDSLERLLLGIKLDSIDAVFGNHDYYYDKCIVKRVPRVNKGIYTFADIEDKLIDDGTLTGILFGSVCGAIYKRKIIEDYNIRYRKDIAINEDGIFNIEYLLNTEKICVLKESVYLYRKWKTKQKLKLVIDENYLVATSKIESILRNKIDYNMFEIQMHRRKISVAFWHSLMIRGNNIKYPEAKLFLVSIFSNQEMYHHFQYMNYRKMNCYKRFLCATLKYRMYFLYYILIHHVSAILENRIRR